MMHVEFLLGYIWRVRGEGQQVFTHVVTKRPLLSEVEPLLHWFDEEKRPVVEVHFCGQATVDMSTEPPGYVPPEPTGEL